MIKKLKLVISVAAIASIGSAIPAYAADGVVAKPTIVLVHGAFADSSSWDGVSAKLRQSGYTVIGAANPLRGVAGDGAAVSAIVKSISGPVVLVGHSYGGNVVTAAAEGNANVKSLVYVAAFAPDAGEHALGLSGKFPGSTLGPTLAPPVTLADGSKEFYIDQSKFHAQFAADLPKRQAELMAVGQRPIAEVAFTEVTKTPTWKHVPSYFIYGSADKNIPAAALSFMAVRAQSRHTVEIKGASHVVMTSHPAAVAKLIDEAARAK